MKIKNVRQEPNVFLFCILVDYFFLISVFTFLTTFLAGAFLITFFATAFTGALLAGVAIILTTGLVTFLLRYCELSNARIGMNTILINRIPSPYARCFQNLSAILK